MNGAPTHPKLQIRLLGESDQQLYLQLYGDEATMRYIGPSLDEKQARRSFASACRLNQSDPPTARFWVIEDCATGLAIGLIGLHWDGPASAELGVVLPPEHQGKGIATRVIRILLAVAFDSLRLDRLHTRHVAGHFLAGGLMASLGFAALPHPAEGGVRCWELAASRWQGA
ncbi:MAG: GNAT family N-acetyltransferase [Rhizobium sp.]|nr:GNAT family N-acetyltransferase [Rhizobium sp.]